MLKSMTGFGKAYWEDDQVRIIVESKTLNAKHADVSMRLPAMYADKEIAWKNLLIEHLERGRISITINCDNKQTEVSQIELNLNLFKQYYGILSAWAEELKAPTSVIFPLALKIPGVIHPANEPTADETITSKIEKIIKIAIHKCEETRQEEGAVLSQKIAEYVAHINQGLKAVEELDHKRLVTTRSKLVDKLHALQGPLPIDENRLEQELIYYIERMDITEEKVRLAKHLAYFETVMYHEEAAGKKLGFIAQEMGREINTIGAKANDAAIQKQVILIKDELEKIKEQLQNIL